MNLIGLDHKPFKLNTNPNLHPMKNEEGCKSKIQYRCGQILKEKYPFDVILEEVYIPKHPFILDFFLPLRKLVVEINGDQHDKFVKFFHGSFKNFVKSQHRDNDKAYWAEINNLRFISVKTEEELRKALNE